MPRLTFILFLVICQIYPLQSERLHTVPNDLRTKLTKANPSFLIKSRTFGNLFFKLKKNQLHKASNLSSSIKHFKGLLRSSQGTSPAAATLNGSELVMFFQKPSKKRRHLVAINIDLKSNHNSYISRIPMTATANCGNYLTASSSKLSNFRQLPYQPLRYLEVSTDADFQYFSIYGKKTFAKIQSILNAVDVLYMSQLGIKLQLVRQHAFTSAKQPFRSSSPFRVLRQFKQYTINNWHLGTPDIFHLFSGRIFNDSIIGLSFVAKTCSDLSSSFGLTQKLNKSVQALVTAHEIGHVLGATHPEDSQLNPEDSLMTGIVRPDHQSFSDFSLNQINSHLGTDQNCLSEEPGSSAALSANFNKDTSLLSITGTFVSRVESLDSCSMKLLANSNKVKLFNNKGITLLSEPAANGEFSFQKTISSRSKRLQRLFIKTLLNCGSNLDVSSQITKVEIPFKSSKQLNRFLRKTS